MRTFLVTFDECFSVIHADSLDELHNLLKNDDNNFSFKDDKIFYYFFGDNFVEVSIKDKTDEHGIFFSGAFG